ncbi:MAG: hypothetical protein QHJ82_03565 [Verrucomicrobiota bacterium]|nr:hypothetical protein [Verrucomicrobiota bacterium]
MLRIEQKRRIQNGKASNGAERLSTQRTVLSLSWIDGAVRALAVHKGVVEGSWECPDTVADAAGFGAVLRLAVAHTGYKGTAVSIALAHPRLSQQLLATPPIMRRSLMSCLERQVQMLLYLGVPPDFQPALARYIERQVQSLKSFDGEAAWCFEYTVPIEETNGLLVHLFPRQILDTLAAECDTAGLWLTAVVPITSVLQSQVQHLPIGQEEVAMLVGDTGRSTAVVVSRGDGQLYLSRMLAGVWPDNAEQLIVDLQRTAVFVKEEYGVGVSGVWLFGPDMQNHTRRVQAETGIPTTESPVPWDAFYWPREVCSLVPAMMPNFISWEQLHAPRERLWLKLISAGALLVVVSCVATSAYIEWTLRQERAGLKEIQARTAETEKQKTEAQKRNEELEIKRETIRLVDSERLPPVPAWFMGYLSEAVPEDILLTSLEVHREGEQWRIKLSGVPQPSTNAPSAAVLSNSVEELKRRLASGPFHVAFVSGSNRGPKLKSADAAPKPLSAWVGELGKVVGKQEPKNLEFKLEGVME